MASQTPMMVALVGDTAACTVIAERLCGDRDAIFKLGGRAYRLAGDPSASDSLARLVADPSRSDAAILALDPDRGLTIEVRSAAFVLELLGRRIVAAVSDDGADGDRFARLARDCADYLERIGVALHVVVPVASDGAGAPAWHRGPSLADALAAPRSSRGDPPLRVSLDAPAAGTDARRVRGRVVCGQLAVGDTLLLSPANVTARLVALSDPASTSAKEHAGAGEAFEATFDADVPPPPGQLASHVKTPPVETDVFRVRLFWAGVAPLRAGEHHTAHLPGVECPATVQSIERIVSTPNFADQDESSAVAGDIVECVLRLPEIVALDSYDDCPPTGWLTLHGDEGMVAAGAIGMEGYADQRGLITVRSTNVSRAGAVVSAEVRSARNGHRGGVLWLTGLSGAGKSTIAAEAERRLFEKGYQVGVLDGDNLRHGLSADLGFSPEDRAENIRRIGEVGALFARAGLIAITAFISPYRSDRERARAAYPDAFAEIYVRADIATCEARDPKGLYKKARAGEIPEFTGVSAPYEAPESPELVIDTDRSGIDASVDILLNYVEAQFALSPVLPPS